MKTNLRAFNSKRFTRTEKPRIAQIIMTIWILSLVQKESIERQNESEESNNNGN